jgi:small subunit ribosomal protein S3
MGRKVHPLGFRLGGIRDWQAKWYAEKDYAESLQEDLKLREAIQSEYARAAISQIQIDRQANKVTVTIHTARPGVVIGRGGQRVDKMRLHLESLLDKKIQLNIQEIQQPELDAYLIARTIADQIESRISYRRAMKQAISRTIMAGAKGIRISCAGRLGGAEIARRQTMHEGQVPLHTLRADIDYGFAEARTTLGRIGVKVWTYKGDILPELELLEVEEAPPEAVAVETAEAVAEVRPEEAPPEAVAVETVEVAPEAKPKRKPAKPAAKKEKPAKPVAVETAEAAPEVKPKRKPAKPVAKKEKPAKPAARKRVKKAPVAKPKKGVTQPAVETTAEADASTITEKEEKDVTTQTGKIPQES